MTNENVRTCALTLHAPCDLTGQNARRFCSAVAGMDGRVRIEKSCEQRCCRGDSLLGVLSLGVRKGDMIALHTAPRQAGQLTETIAQLALQAWEGDPMANG